MQRGQCVGLELTLDSNCENIRTYETATGGCYYCTINSRQRAPVMLLMEQLHTLDHKTVQETRRF